MSLKILLIITGFFLTFGITFSNEISGYELYKYRVEKICEIKGNDGKKKYNLETKKIFLTKKYEKIDNPEKSGIEEAKTNYRNNMNKIYKCALLQTQISSYNLIKDSLIKNNPNLKKDLERKIKHKINKINLVKNKLKCKGNSSEINSIKKLDILKQTTYELCKYHSYLEYLREHNSNLKNLVDSDILETENNKQGKTVLKKDFDLEYIINLEKKKKTEIDEEIKHSYKIFPIAYEAYSEYENNITIHLLLELLKQDFMTYREKLHKVINPINQVIYKIANATKLQ